MTQYAGLDVSQKETTICIVDEQGRRAALTSRVLRAGLGRTAPFLTTAGQARPYAGSSTRIRQG
jgi:hypothetical protein